MFLKSLTLSNFLSYGPKECKIPLGDLNVLVGANGSGKSNLIEAISLLQSTPTQLTSPVNVGGGVSDWLWRGCENFTPTASVSAVIHNGNVFSSDIMYSLSFTSVHERFEIVKEEIKENGLSCGDGDKEPLIYYEHDRDKDQTVLAFHESADSGKLIQRKLKREEIEPSNSVLAQRKDSFAYPEITNLGKQFGAVKIYREWCFGTRSAIRQPQPTDTDNMHLACDCRNLAVVLNRLQESNSLRRKIRDYVQDVYEGARDVSTRLEGGRALVIMSEDGLDMAIPANRLSDGTLRYLCLMCILLDPMPPPLVCIEEPDLGLHPDLIMRLADMLKEASQRTQLIITTHSPLLLSEFTDMPDVVRVFEKANGISDVRQFNEKELKTWIKIYGSLGETWRSGELGGNRW